MPVVDVCWVGELPADHDAENGGALQGALPVFVSVLDARLPAGVALKAELAALTQAVSVASSIRRNSPGS